MTVERYRHNAGAVFSLKYHLLWCPKYRKQVLTGAVEVRLKELLAEKAQALGVTMHALKVMPDHVHLFLESDPTKAPAHLAVQFKGYTARPRRVPTPQKQPALSLEPKLLHRFGGASLRCDRSALHRPAEKALNA